MKGYITDVMREDFSQFLLKRISILSLSYDKDIRPGSVKRNIVNHLRE